MYITQDTKPVIVYMDTYLLGDITSLNSQKTYMCNRRNNAQYLIETYN